MSEYVVTLIIPKRYEEKAHEKILKEDPCEWKSAWGIISYVFCYVRNELELEKYLVENRVPFDRISQATERSHDGEESSIRYFRPGGCICGGDYDCELLTLNSGEHFIPISENERGFRITSLLVLTGGIQMSYKVNEAWV